MSEDVRPDPVIEGEKPAGWYLRQARHDWANKVMVGAAHALKTGGPAAYDRFIAEAKDGAPRIVKWSLRNG